MRPPTIFRISLPSKEPAPAALAPPARLEATAGQLRAFIGFFDRRLRHLDATRSDGSLSKAELGVLTALGRRRGAIPASELLRQVAIDQGYLSRIVKRLEAWGLVERRRGKDGRQSPIAATAAGRALLGRLDREVAQAVSELLRPLSKTAEDDLVSAMARMREILKPPPAPQDGEEAEEDDAAPLSSALDDVHLRALRGGDVGLVAHRLSVLHRQGKPFDAEIDRRLLAKAAAFLEGFDRARDIGWIAERHGRLAGACLLKGERTGASGAGMSEVAIIHVEPEARGIGLARMLLDQCLAFAAIAKYTSVAARAAGGENEIADALEALEFRIVRREQTAGFGGDELERVWEKRL